MQYLVISNKGTIPFEFIELLGAGEPREGDKLRYFHTGAKYALTAAKRLGIDIVLYSDNWKMAIDTENIEVQSNGKMVPIERILFRYRMRGGGTKMTKAGFTSEIGPNWTDPWFVVREFMANAMDQEGFDFTIEDIDDVWSLNYATKETQVYIQATPAIRGIVSNMVQYIRRDDGYLIKGVGRIMRRVGPSPIIYHKGVRVAALQDESLFDYDLDVCELTEERTIKSLYDVRFEIAKLWNRCTELDLLKKLLTVRNKKKYIEGQMPWWVVRNSDLKKAWDLLFGDEAVIAKTSELAAEAGKHAIVAIAPDENEGEAHNTEATAALMDAGVESLEQKVGEIGQFDLVEMTPEHANNVELAYQILEDVRPGIRTLPVKAFNPTPAQSTFYGFLQKGPVVNGTLTWFIAQNKNIGNNPIDVARNILHEANHFMTKAYHGDGDLELLNKQENLIIEILMRKWKEKIQIEVSKTERTENERHLKLPEGVAKVITVSQLGSDVPTFFLPDRILVYLPNEDKGYRILVIKHRPGILCHIAGELTMGEDSVVVRYDNNRMDLSGTYDAALGGSV